MLPLISVGELSWQPWVRAVPSSGSVPALFFPRLCSVELPPRYVGPVSAQEGAEVIQYLVGIRCHS